MLDELSSTCEGCQRGLVGEWLMVEYRTDEGVRRAYECACGRVTVTVASRP